MRVASEHHYPILSLVLAITCLVAGLGRLVYVAQQARRERGNQLDEVLREVRSYRIQTRIWFGVVALIEYRLGA